MRHLFFFFGISLVFAACRGAGTPIQSAEVPARHIETSLVSGIDSTVPNTDAEYSRLTFINAEKLPAAPGTKSVLFNSRGSRLFAMNLEGMSIYEFEQRSRKIIREFKFSPTRGIGWDYVRDKPIPSFQEKPVEACLSHDDRILWVSLHNAEGIVPIRLDDLDSNRKTITGLETKKLKVRCSNS